MNFTIDCKQDAGPLAPFWNSIGFSPAELLLTHDMQQALTYYGSVPHQGIHFVRIHYLLNLVKVTGSGGGSPPVRLVLAGSKPGLAGAQPPQAVF